ncbi:hypothetical protein GCM10027085_52860 [Spirosoma aerophilum]
MLPYSEIGLRLALAALLGGAVGLDRQRLNWAAGLRTQLRVCSGAALFMMVSAFGFVDILTQDHVALDPSRIAAQVVSGVGFFGQIPSLSVAIPFMASPRQLVYGW